MKQDEAARQCEVDMVIDSDDPTELGPPPRRSMVSKQSATGSQSSTPDRIKFVAGWVSKQDRSIANLVVEETTLLALASKPAFRQMIDTAIEIGTHIGKDVYAHSGEKRLRNDTIPAVIKKQESTTSLVDFDSNLARFGGTLASDGKDDVSHDHLINYLTVCPDGYRFELSKDITGYGVDVMAGMDGMASEVWEEFINCATRMLKAAPPERGFTIDQVTAEYASYQNLTGGFNSKVIARAEGQPAHLW